MEEHEEKIVYRAQPPDRKTRKTMSKTKEKTQKKTSKDPFFSTASKPQNSPRKKKKKTTQNNFNPPKVTGNPLFPNSPPPLSHTPPGLFSRSISENRVSSDPPKDPEAHYRSHSSSSIQNSEELFGVALCFAETEELF